MLLLKLPVIKGRYGKEVTLTIRLPLVLAMWSDMASSEGFDVCGCVDCFDEVALSIHEMLGTV